MLHKHLEVDEESQMKRIVCNGKCCSLPTALYGSKD